MLRTRVFRLLVCVALVGAAGAAIAAEQAFSPADLEFFEKRVRPILAERCYECHAAGKNKEKGGLRLDDRGAVLAGGDSGPAAVPGEPEKSLLVEAVRYDPNGLQMPPAGKLPEREIDILVEWVRRGLPHPTSAEAATARQGVDLVAGRKHWAFQPLAVQPLPAGVDVSRFPHRIDAFLEAKRREHGLQPSPQADPRTLIRRASFDLLGLPPALDDLQRWEAALASAGPLFDERYAAIVDELLASPHYGERWARHWLDLARYADITESWREGEGQPWRYRDWVVQTLNDDLPYDQFVRYQLAADLLPETSPADHAALGFLGLSPTYWKELKLDHQVIKQVVAEEWEEKLDALGSTFLGLTIGCARCHDHKFDPITTHDYYALAGVLASIRQADRALVPPDAAGSAMAARNQVKELEKKLKPLAAKKEPTEAERAEIDRLQAEIAQLKATPHFDLPIACGVVDAALYVVPAGKNGTKLDYRPGQAQDVALQIRGNPARTGQVVQRRFLSVLAADPQATWQEGSGRRQLAEALVTDAAPLAARVMVNRVWKQHFGHGIVDTTSNFGLQGGAPTHRELLDDLAARFVAGGWSLKWLHREIMTSAAYRQSSYPDPARQAIDPDNRWLWRMTPRRLEVEAWRDAVLVATGQLDTRIGGPPVDLGAATNRRRTLYGTVKRREVNELLRLFDFPDPVAHAAQREPTITPLQQLFVLNSSFFEQQSRALVSEVLRQRTGLRERVEVIYSRAFQRLPTTSEIAVAEQFMADARAGQASEADAWRQYAHAILASNEFLFID
jgi:hypothetical protein